MQIITLLLIGSLKSTYILQFLAVIINQCHQKNRKTRTGKSPKCQSSCRKKLQLDDFVQEPTNDVFKEDVQDKEDLYNDDDQDVALRPTRI